MKLIDLTIKEFLNEVDSPSPAPGGGSVSALAIAEGISLLRMVAHLTITKKKFLGLDKLIKQDYLNRMNQLAMLKDEVLLLIDKDTEAFNKIMEAFKLPKNTPQEEHVRVEAVDKATVEATEVPYQTCKIAFEAMDISVSMFKYANKNATSDFGVGMMMINAGLVGAALNVRTNMTHFSDDTIAKKYLDEVFDFESRAKVILEKAMENVNNSF